MKLDPEYSGRNSEEAQISNFQFLQLEFLKIQSTKNVLTIKI